MSTPLPGSSLSPPAATNAIAPPLATATFAFPLPPASSGSPPPPLATISLFRSITSTELVVVVVVVVVVVGVVVVVVRLLFIHCKKKGWWLCSASPCIALRSGNRRFTLAQVQQATNVFAEANLLGEGGFGRVYCGVIPPREFVAVKRLKLVNGQGEGEFSTEVEIISRVHHKHVVSLVGYCTTGSERILVYELVPNGTLESHLHGERQETLNWPARLKIASGSAKGLAYLHEGCHPKIIHHDIKAANILVDFEFEPKIADFGLAKSTTELISHVSTCAKGTFGYLDPEYFSTGKLTEKSDIFSFGVVLLELITGHKPRGLVTWARPMLTRYLEDGGLDSLVDPRLQNKYDGKQMARMVACAAACVRCSAGRRPKMSKIVRALEGDLPLSDLNDGIRPGLSILWRYRGSSDCSTSHDPKRSGKMPLASQEYGSSHYGDSSGEGPSRPITGDLEMGRMERDSQGFGGGS
ncbi:hypothetical protein BT93_C2256 [Corymbia citriodora subsp. variegata]|nr:hypothetical protein BT93_C2256 [Corymbia citriodora subsp. variegata]